MTNDVSKEFESGYFHGEGSNYPSSGYAAWWRLNYPKYVASIREALQCYDRWPGLWLDLGCAYGYVAAQIAKLGLEVCGVDISEHALRRAQGLGVEVIRASADCLPFRSYAVDAICAFEVLEHVAEPLKAVREISRVGHKGCAILLTTPTKRKRTDRDRTHVSIQPAHAWLSQFAEVGVFPCRFLYMRRDVQILNLAVRALPLRFRYVLFYLLARIAIPSALWVMLRKA